MSIKVGDEVRVKAGSPVHPNTPNTGWRSSPFKRAFGKKCVVESIDTDNWGTAARIRYKNGFEGLDIRHLEPWNPDEEWNGQQWVKKPTDRWFRTKNNGKVYKVISVSPNGDCVLDFEGFSVFFYKNDVEEVYNYNPEKDKSKPAIVIMREDGFLKPHIHHTVHESTSKAKEEAKRLAELHEGQEFVVFQEVDRKKVDKPAYPELKRGDVMKAIRKTESIMGKSVADGEVVIVDCDGDTLFGAKRGTVHLTLKKSDFVKIGHIDL